ncbi:unnamed protein product [marine sediment metagenome]|uniref:Resolvase HTH domain-containing protein n=1 Tax=marine sediment metagenome TaxID=412755 RepID=X0WSU0_9ZZZZ
MTNGPDVPGGERRQRRGRPPGKKNATQAELDQFVERLAMGWTVAEAAKSIGRSRQSLYALRKRHTRFRQDWEDTEKEVLLREEEYFTYVRELGFPGLAATAAGLTWGHVYHRLRTDPIFKERSDAGKSEKVAALWRQVIKGAEKDPRLQWKILQAMARDLFC